KAIALEDVGERGGDDRINAQFLNGPDGMLATGTAAEVLAGEQDGGAGIALVVEDEARILAPRLEGKTTVAGALDALEVPSGNDLVGIDVRSVQRNRFAANGGHGPHFSTSLMSTKCPAIAAAAAISGLTRWVRPPGP